MHSNENARPTEATKTVGDIAHLIIAEQVAVILEKEARILETEDVEAVHKVRVASRRLQTALTIFDASLILPKRCQVPRIKSYVRRMGALRDLDVQLMHIEQQDRTLHAEKDHQALARLKKRLTQQRKKVRADVVEDLQSTAHQKMHRAFAKWLAKPKLRTAAAWPVPLILPELLLPTVTRFMQHPAWLLDPDPGSSQFRATVHDLRKLGKQVRYQTEFFTQYYRADFKDWLLDLESLQDQLGALQDSYTLSDQIEKTKRAKGLRALVAQQQRDALNEWPAVRARMIDPEFRGRMYAMLLHPTVADNPVG